MDTFVIKLESCGVRPCAPHGGFSGLSSPESPLELAATGTAVSLCVIKTLSRSLASYVRFSGSDDQLLIFDFGLWNERSMTEAKGKRSIFEFAL
jgi:hypothetical protein